jgi:predicted deacylase
VSPASETVDEWSQEFALCGQHVPLGSQVDLTLPVAESYSGEGVELPVHIRRGVAPGPAVLVSATVHGDELNGIGIIRRLILHPPFELSAGTLVLVPVVNLLGYERHTRYLPDRRDLNRVFPGSEKGSLARRYAHRFFHEIVRHCEFGIDLHTAAVRRVNYPNVRGNLRVAAVRRIAEAFGCELVVNGAGPKGSLRREATRADCPMILLEAGEAWKIEPAVTDIGVRGVTNVLIELGMVEGEPDRPRYQSRVDKTKWIRAEFGGLLQFHVAPGDIVTAGQALATNTNLLGRWQNQVSSPAAGVVLGMTTLPAVNPGDPIVHLALPRGGVRRLRKALAEGDLAERARDDLATSVDVTEPD